MKTILLLEDDENLNRGITFKLKKEGYNVLSATTVAEATTYFENEHVDLIVSDVNLPDGNGFDFCETIRSKSDVRILFLTALDQEVDVVTGYEVGADDYLTKPFSLIILISKVNALMRRVDTVQLSTKIRCGELEFDMGKLTLYKNNQEIILSKTEMKLFRYFIQNSKQLLSKDQLLSALWDVDGQFVDENTIAVNIRRLREKIEEVPSKPKYIQNIRGLGYIFNNPGSENNSGGVA